MVDEKLKFGSKRTSEDTSKNCALKFGVNSILGDFQEGSSEYPGEAIVCSYYRCSYCFEELSACICLKWNAIRDTSSHLANYPEIKYYANDVRPERNCVLPSSSKGASSCVVNGSSTSYGRRGRIRMTRRAVFSEAQRMALENKFTANKYISKPDRGKLAQQLMLNDSQVKIWFQNRRMKWRNNKERELLSKGGNRKQTLPVRNKNHPSDVRKVLNNYLIDAL